MQLDVLQVKVWSEVYSSVIEDTKGYVEKKQASTYEELVAEQELKAEEVSDHTFLSVHERVQHYRLSACVQCQIGQVSLPLMKAVICLSRQGLFNEEATAGIISLVLLLC